MSDDYTDLLSDYLDGEDQSPAERARIERHLAACTECRRTLDELRQVAHQASVLPDAPPPADLWPGVAMRIGAAAPWKISALTPLRPVVRRISFTVPQLVAAGLALMVLSGGTVWLVRQGGSHTDFEPVAAQVAADGPKTEPRDTAAAEVEYDEAVADLQRTIDAGRGRVDPETVRVLESNLRAIDAAIEQSRRALAADPESIYLNSHLASTQRRKLALLRRTSALIAARS